MDGTHSMLVISEIDENGVKMGSLLVNVTDYENGDEQMIREAFGFSVNLLRSSFPDVNLTETSASVKYAKTMDKKPQDVVAAERIHQHLKSLGYIRKILR